MFKSNSIDPDASVDASVSRTSIVGRDATLDIARGLAMILVVLGHTLVGVVNAGQDLQIYRFEILTIYTTHMALFFLISASLSQSLRSRPWPGFLRQVGARILWPYLLWSLVLLTTFHIMKNHVNTGPEGIYNPLSILWKPPSIMWFLYAMFVAVVAARLLVPFPRWASVAVGGVIFALAYLADDVPQSARFVGLYLICAPFGRAVIDILARPVWIYVSVAIMIGTVAMAWHDASTGLHGYPAHAIPYIPALIAGPTLVVGLSRWIAGWSHRTALISQTLSLIGQRTMAIFVTHILVTAGTRIALVGVGVTNWTAIAVAATALGIALPLVAAGLADRLRVTGALGWR